MGTTRVAATEVLTPEGWIGPAEVVVDDGVIVDIQRATAAPDVRLVPGFVDLQVNGHDDIDVAHATGDDWDRLDGLLAAQGVTTWCPTLVTSPLEAYEAPLARVAEAAARPSPRPRIAGAHLEGPFLGAMPGAHPAHLLRPLDKAWLAGIPDVLAVVTLGPELPGAADAVAELAARGVLVALGHSAATFEEVRVATDAGATLVTHCFNGMPPLHHRAPGIVGAALSDDRLAVSLIADLVHVHPAALAVAFRAKGTGRVALVTDAVAWRARTVGGIEVRFDGQAPRLPDGTLAGSALTMDRAVANVVRSGVASIEDAVRAASSTPARLLGLDDRGAIAAGRRADLVALGPDLEVMATWVDGQQIHPVL